MNTRMNHSHVNSNGLLLFAQGLIMNDDLLTVGNRVFRRVRLGLVMALLLVVCGRASAQTENNPQHTASRQELDIVKVVLEQEKAWNDGDLAAYMRGFKDSPDTVFIGKDISRGTAQILADYKRIYPTRELMGTLAFSDLEVHPLSERFAVCTGRYQLDRGKRQGGVATGLFSLVMEKTDAGWKIVVDHTP
jgi:ketosteroid isomerase-like protein